MASETINELVGTLSELESRLKQFDAEAHRLGELRGELKGATAGLQSAGKDLQAVASALRDGASTMRELDMAATLRRLAEIEATLDARSKQLEVAVDREIAELGESLKHQVSKQLDALPAQIGSIVAHAFDQQFATTKAAIDSLVTDAGSRHQALTTTLQSSDNKLLTVMNDWRTAEMNSTAQLENTMRESQSTQLGSIMTSLDAAEYRNTAQANSLEAVLLAGTRKAGLMATHAFIVAMLGAIAAVISIFI